MQPAPLSRMKDGPNIVRIAALIGDHTRTEVLTALLGGKALTATELAAVLQRATDAGSLRRA